MAERPVVVWFRQDLRLCDHPALTAAVATGQPVIPLYVLDDETPRPWAMGSASRWWLHGSLESLGRSLEARGTKLVLRRGRALDVVRDVVREAKAGDVYVTRAYEPYARDLEVSLKAAFQEEGVEFKRYAGALLHEPDQLLTQQGGPYRVYTPFWRALSGTAKIDQPLPAPDKISGAKVKLKSETLSSWGLLPSKPIGPEAFARRGRQAKAERRRVFLVSCRQLLPITPSNATGPTSRGLRGSRHTFISAK